MFSIKHLAVNELMLNEMISSTIARYTTLFGAIVLMSFVSSTFSDEKKALNETKIIYLIRHAEKEKGHTNNPNLTEKGRLRATNLAKMLKSKNIEIIYSTQYARTMQTASPLAKELGLTIQNYDPRKLKEFSESLLAKQVNMLIVGHSNTTPFLVKLLGGNAGDKINESEYNRVYKLQINENTIETELLRSSSL